MKTIKANIEDFQADILSKNEQKIVHGGDGEDYPPHEPGKDGKNGNG